jgi:hypothetical protein
MAWRTGKDGECYYEALSLEDLQCRDEELAWMDLNRRPWKMVNGMIEQSGAPTALAGGFAGLELTPNVLTPPTITMGATELSLWSVPTFTPIAANPQQPKAYMLRSWGYCTTAATPGSILFNARLGQLVTSPLLGASVTAAQTASQTTANFRLEGDVILRTGGGATTGTATGQFRYSQSTAVTGAGPELAACSQIIGNGSTVTSYESDAALANGLWIGGIATTSTTNTYIPLGIIWASWN